MYFEETMSREYLQGLVQMKKRAQHERHVGALVKDIMQKIGAAAATGATCYLYETPNLAGLQEQMLVEATRDYRSVQGTLTGAYNIGRRDVNGAYVHEQLPLPPTLVPLPITMEDIVEALKLKCPGCDVGHQESWVDFAPSTRVLKKGIYISWE